MDDEDAVVSSAAWRAKTTTSGPMKSAIWTASALPPLAVTVNCVSVGMVALALADGRCPPSIHHSLPNCYMNSLSMGRCTYPGFWHWYHSKEALQFRPGDGKKCGEQFGLISG